MKREKKSPDRPGMAVDVELLSERQLRARRGQRDNLFAWTVFLLLLIGVVFACWIGSFYVFQHPENARSYKILRKLKKIDPPKRFESTLAPNGRFYSAKDLRKLYADKTETELARINLELLQAYIGNYGVKELQVPYLMGQFSVIRAQPLSKNDLIPSGFVALARSVSEPKLIIEQLYPADAEYTEDLRQMLQPGVEIKLERTYDLSAVLHVEKWPGDLVQVTIVPLNYDSYGLGDGREVRLQPPSMPNPAGLLPIMDLPLENASGQTAIASAAQGKPAPAAEEKTVAVLARSGPTPDQSVTRIARALPVAGAAAPIPKSTPAPSPALAIPAATPSAIATIAAIATPKPGATPLVLAAIPLASATPAPVFTTTTTPTTTPTPTPAPTPTPKTVIASSALPAPKTAANWQTYRPGQMPRGRLLNVPDLDTLAKAGGPRGTTYLQGNFVVKATDGNRAVMRASNRLVSAIGLGAAAQGQARVIVEYPGGQSVPKAGAQVSRDSNRPFQITAVRRDAQGQVNVFVREVTEP